MSRYTVQSLSEDLIRLGLSKGDTVLVRGAVGKIGKLEQSHSESILNSFFNVIGEEGTIIGLSFTDQFFIYALNKDYVFDRSTPSKAGALANILLAHPEAKRSSHPINSFVAIGKNAESIIAGHDETAHGYLPMEKLLALKAKMMLFGCVNNSPGFTTVHLAQENLGLSYRTPFRNLFGVLYNKDGEKRLFKRKSIGGCSKGFYKFYADYVNNEKLRMGRYGNAYSLMINCIDAYEIEYEILKKNPKYALCDDKDCALCRGLWYYNKIDMPGFFLRNSFAILRKIFKKSEKKTELANKI
jgi:aminoglycoside 3-N-acetyltransferase